MTVQIKKTSRAHGVLAALFSSAMITAALIGVLYFGWRVIGTPFIPFDVFDWMARLLPGRVIAFGIGTMVMVIRALNLGPTSEIAKLAEQAMAITTLFITGIIGGMVLFGIVGAKRGQQGMALGAALGIIISVPAILICLHGSQTASLPPVVSAIWVLAAFL